MAPATMTETSMLENPSHTSEDCRECTLSHRLKEPKVNNNNAEKKQTSPYDETRVKNDPWFLHRVREWEKNVGFVTQLRWMNIILIFLFHIISLTWFICYPFSGNFPKWQTLFFGYVIGQTAGFGVTAGVHRYWCHRSYKAKRPLELILIVCYSMAGQNTIFNWVRDHRVHHKFSETSADPHNVHRGFFFSHVGWLMMKKHPEVLRAGAKIDMSDITGDPLLQFHTKYFNVFKILFCFVLPTIVPVLGWGEGWDYAILSQPLLRYMFSLNCTWSVNSFAHLWGNKPYDRHIMPVENWGVSVVAMGEGWHNYHHTFPWDYKAAELAYSLNLTTVILDLFAKIGWAYDMKVASPSLVQTVAKNRGERPPEE